MSTTVFCPNCRESLDLPDDYLGRSVRCGACQSIFTATAPDDVPTARPVKPTRNKPIPVSRAGDDGPIEYDPEKRRKRRGGGCGLWVVLGSLAFLGCGCCGVVGYFVFAMMNPEFAPYASPDGRFRAKFPNEVRTTQRITGRPNEMAQAVESSRPLIQEQFFIYHVDLSPADVAKPPAEVVQQLAKGLMDTATANGGKPQTRNPAPITHQGYDATEVVIHMVSTHQYTQARVVVADGRGYVIGVTGPGQPNGGSPWVQEFIESLEIVPPAAKPDEDKKPEPEKKPRAEKKPKPEMKGGGEKPALEREKAPKPRLPDDE